ncbi:MAG: MerR family transcriptional regulator [Trichloromonadaceae bacterium]
MALIKTWYEPAAAAEKFGLQESLIMSWVDDGLVRCEREGKVARVNIDDVRLRVEDMLQKK